MASHAPQWIVPTNWLPGGVFVKGVGCIVARSSQDLLRSDGVRFWTGTDWVVRQNAGGPQLGAWPVDPTQAPCPGSGAVAGPGAGPGALPGAGGTGGYGTPAGGTILGISATAWLLLLVAWYMMRDER